MMSAVPLLDRDTGKKTNSESSCCRRLAPAYRQDRVRHRCRCRSWSPSAFSDETNAAIGAEFHPTPVEAQLVFRRNHGDARARFRKCCEDRTQRRNLGSFIITSSPVSGSRRSYRQYHTDGGIPVTMDRLLGFVKVGTTQSAIRLSRTRAPPPAKACDRLQSHGPYSRAQPSTNNDNGRIRRVVFASVYFEGSIFHHSRASLSVRTYHKSDINPMYNLSSFS